MPSLPAIIGGEPLAVPSLPFVRPCLPPLNDLVEPFREIFETGMLTTGPYAEQFGAVIAAHLNVKYAIAVSSCTAGLLLAVQALRLPEGSEVILPSFTFIASGTCLDWNRLRLRFADVDRETMNLDLSSVEAAIHKETSAILAVHQFGNPAPVEALQCLADKHNLPLLYDAAHGFGSLHNGTPVGGEGNAAVFSLSPSKPLIAGEGGIVATNDDALAEHIIQGRNYGNPGNYDCLFPGINARMSEFHAILALRSFAMLEPSIQRRNEAAGYYRERLARLPGIGFQTITKGCRSSYKDFSITVDETAFGVSRGRLAEALLDDGIHTRVYYSPVLHQMTAFRQYTPTNENTLTNTIHLQQRALSLPLYSDMKEEELDVICSAIERIHTHAGAVASVS